MPQVYTYFTNSLYYSLLIFLNINISKDKPLLKADEMRTIMIGFDNADQRDEFIKIVKTTADTLLESTVVANNEAGKILNKALESIKLDPPIKLDSERIVALFVSGRKKSEGMLADMNKAFSLEVGSHSASVELRELRGGTWVTIRSRRVQQ